MKLIDAFMAFLVVVGGVQFVYCVLVGNYVRLFSFSFIWFFFGVLGFGFDMGKGEFRLELIESGYLPETAF